MKIIKEEVKTFVEKLMCDNCNGEMKFSGNTLSGNPPINIHICESCAVVQEVREDTYPKTSYEYVEEDVCKDYSIMFSSSTGNTETRNVSVSRRRLEKCVDKIKEDGGRQVTIQDTETGMIIYYDERFSDGT